MKDDFENAEGVDDARDVPPTEIAALIGALGIESAWISDASRLSDFGISVDVIAERLGIEVKRDDRIVDIAKRMPVSSNSRMPLS